MNRPHGWKKQTTLFLCAQTISLFGSALVQYAIVWHITLSTSSGVMMTLATLCGYLPQIAISLFAGVWLDRYSRKAVMMLADAAIAVTTLCIALCFLAGFDSVWLLFVALLARSAGTGIQTPAVNAVIPQIVPKERLMRINGINSSIQSLMMFLSPALSGVILTVSSIEATFFIDVITAAVGIGIMFFIPIARLVPDKTARADSALGEMRQGFAYLKNNRFILKQMLFLVTVMILISPSAFLTPLLVSRSFGAEVWRLTLSQMTFGVGAVLGGLLISTWGGFQNRMHTILLATLAYGSMMVAMGLSPVYPSFLTFNFLIGISMPCFNAPVNVLLQEKVEPAMQGRIFSVLQIANACSLPLGTVIFGPLADAVRVQSILIGNGLAVILCAALVWRSGQFAEG